MSCYVFLPKECVNAQKTLLSTSIFLILIAISAKTATALDTPPEIDAIGDRDGIIVSISGTVVDEAPENVRLFVRLLTGEEMMVGSPDKTGRFSFEMPVPLRQIAVVVIAEDQDGLRDDIVVDIPFAP